MKAHLREAMMPIHPVREALSSLQTEPMSSSHSLAGSGLCQSQKHATAITNAFVTWRPRVVKS